MHTCTVTQPCRCTQEARAALGAASIEPRRACTRTCLCRGAGNKCSRRVYAHSSATACSASSAAGGPPAHVAASLRLHCCTHCCTAVAAGVNAASRGLARTWLRAGDRSMLPCCSSLPRPALHSRLHGFQIVQWSCFTDKSSDSVRGAAAPVPLRLAPAGVQCSACFARRPQARACTPGPRRPLSPPRLSWHDQMYVSNAPHPQNLPLRPPGRQAPRFVKSHFFRPLGLR